MSRSADVEKDMRRRGGENMSTSSSGASASASGLDSESAGVTREVSLNVQRGEMVGGSKTQKCDKNTEHEGRLVDHGAKQDNTEVHTLFQA